MLSSRLLLVNPKPNRLIIIVGPLYKIGGVFGVNGPPCFYNSTVILITIINQNLMAMPIFFSQNFAQMIKAVHKNVDSDLFNV